MKKPNFLVIKRLIIEYLFMIRFLILFIVFCIDVLPQNYSRNYEDLKTEIGNKRSELSKSYLSTGINKDSVISYTQNFLFNKIVNEIFPAWYNTKWSFNGTTTTPGKGSIACGYFVTTVLKDAGFNIPRVSWAQLPSESMILKLNKDVKRFRNRTAAEVETYISSNGKGIYIVGLDIHVGFLINDGTNVMFIHSNYYRPDIGVMKENLAGDNPFADSSYRVVGKILKKEMIEKWLIDYKFE